MGSKDSFAGGGGNIGNDLREGIDDWLANLPGSGGVPPTVSPSPQADSTPAESATARLTPRAQRVARTSLLFKTASGSVMMIANAAALDTFLRALNESGYPPDLPFLDAHGNPSIAHGMAPSGDDWEIGYEAPRDPDTGVPHCCQCAEHTPAQCGAGAMWTPTFPIVAITARQPTADLA